MKPEINHEPIEMQLLLPFLKEMLAEGKTIKMTVTGNSMFPLLRDRQDGVLLSAKNQLKKYDVALFLRSNGEAVLHRIVAVKNQEYIMLGDNQYEKEGPIKESQIIAVATGFYRGHHFFTCRTWWYRLYTLIWSRVGLGRKVLKPAVVYCGRLIKRIEGME